MEWVETTAKTVEAAREAALDQLGVGADEAEFDVVETPRPGLFGRVRGQARVRARVKPTPVRPKQERRRRKEKPKSKAKSGAKRQGGDARSPRDAGGEPVPAAAGGNGPDADTESSDASATGSPRSRGGRRRGTTNQQREEHPMSNEADRPESTVTPDEVGAAAVTFMEGLTDAFGMEATTNLDVDGIELEVEVTGQELGLLVGPGGRTLNAIQDLARVAAQRRLGDHDTRLRIDVAGYRERRHAALARFALDVAESVRSSGTPRSLEPMSSADRKVIHDVLNEQEGVSSRSEGEDPNRRIVVDPA